MGEKAVLEKAVLEKAAFVGLLLTAGFFPPLPSPSKAAVEYAHGNVCLKLNCECAHPRKMRRDPHAENGNVTFAFFAQRLVWMLLLIFFLLLLEL